MKVACFTTLAAATWTANAQLNPPNWPPSVSIFTPDDPTIQQTVDDAFIINGGHDPADNGEFSDNRYAFFFAPGEYSVDIPVGFYTSVYGLGDSPDDVVFNGAKGVYCEEGDYDFTVGSLDTFWRSAENFRNEGAYPWWNGANGMLWAVSQAAPLRRVHTTTDLLLFQYTSGDAAGYASGGYLGNSYVEGAVQSGSQQQWLTRNTEIGGGFPQGVWNMVFVGSTGTPEAHCGEGTNADDYGVPYVVVDTTPTVLAEKPFITIDDAGLFYLRIPAVQEAGRSGADWRSGEDSSDKSVSFEQVYVARNDTDTADSINEALSKGLHLVITPGIYQLDSALVVKTEGQVVLGLGFATLISANGNACIEIGDVSGVRVAGLLLQAGPTDTNALLSVGAEGSTFSADASNPVVLSDVFARVGGPDGPDGVAQADTMVAIYNGNVIGDNFWLWRADHTANGAPVMNGQFPCNHAIVVEGDDVSIYGLAVEHTLQDLAVWNGDNGGVYFFQSELPYDVTQANFGDMNYTGLLVGADASSFEGYGIGVYHYFRDNEVIVESGIVAPEDATFVSPLSVYLNGLGKINHVLNEEGDATSEFDDGQAYVCPDNN